jgi:hypothetical protein
MEKPTFENHWIIKQQNDINKYGDKLTEKQQIIHLKMNICTWLNISYEELDKFFKYEIGHVHKETKEKRTIFIKGKIIEETLFNKLLLKQYKVKTS